MIRLQNICLLSVLLLAATFANAQELKYRLIEETIDKLEVYNDNNTYFSGDIVIPSETQYNGQTLPVNGIAKDAFKGSEELTSISIPSSVQHIGENAFLNCNSLTKATFSSLEDLCNITFDNEYANPLYYGHKLYIDELKVTDLILPYGVTVIKPFAFAGGHFSRIQLSASITSIGNNAFINCKEGYTLLYANLNQLTDIEYGRDNSNPMGRAGIVALSSEEALTEEININTNIIKPYAFKGAKWLKKVTISGSIESIGTEAFRASALEEVVINSALEELSVSLFRDCKNLTKVTLPEATRIIGNNTFQNCPKLTSLPLPQAPGYLTTIGEYAFAYCGFESLEIPATVGQINEGAFSDCSKLKDLVISPRNETEGNTNKLIIGPKAFSKTNENTILKLEHVYSYALVAPQAASDAFNGNTGVELYYKDVGTTQYNHVPDYGYAPWNSDIFTRKTIEEKKITYYIDNNIKKYENTVEVGKPIPAVDKPTRGNGWEFAKWLEDIPTFMPGNNLEIHGYFTKEYTYNGVKYFLRSDTKEAKIVGCNNPSTVTIGSTIRPEGDNDDYNIVAIEDEAFKEAISLTAVDLHQVTNLTSIGNAIFEGCSNLTTVIFPTVQTEIGNSIFKDCAALESVTLPTDLTEITDDMFNGCTKLSTLNLPNTVKKIGASAFAGCTLLSTLVIPDNVDNIGASAFKGCTSYNIDHLPSKLESLGEAAFLNSGIVKITVPKSITTMGNSVFRECVNLEEATFDKEMQLSRLPDNTFNKCSKLEKFTLPTNTVTIGNLAFFQCNGLKQLLLDDTKIATISSSAFNGCTQLKVITLPSTITTLQSNAFSYCSNVEMILIESDDPPYVEDDTFSDAIYNKASLYVKNVEKYDDEQYENTWKKFTKKEAILASLPRLIYKLDGTEIVELSTEYKPGKPIEKKGEELGLSDELYTIYNPDERAFSGWKGEPEIMPNKDVVVNGSLYYQLTYKAEGTEDILNDEKCFFYGDEVSHPDLKKDGLNYVILNEDGSEYVKSNMPAEDITLYVRYTLKNAPIGNSNLKYNGSPQPLISKGSSSTGTLKYSVDNTTFSTDFPTKTDVGTYRVYYRVEGVTTNYNTKSEFLDVTIAPREITSFSLSTSSFVYDGSEKKAAVTVTYNNTTIPSSEYTVSYTNNINVGTATVTLTDKEGGNFIVSGNKTYQIKKATIVLADYMNSDGAPTAKDITYDGTKKELINAGSLKSNTLELEYSLDKTNYGKTIPTGTDAGDYKVYYRVKGNDNYNASDRAELTATIKEKPITIAPENIILDEDYDYAYDGSVKKPDVLSVKWGNETFTKGTHFTVSYSNNTNVGEATVTLTDIKGKGCNYEISGTKTFTILPERSKLTKLPTAKNNIYNGSDQDLINKDGTAVYGKMQYSLSQDKSSFSETVPKGKNAGSYIVYCKVKGDANHSDSEISSVNVTIAPREITTFALSASSFAYDGTEKKPAVTVTYNNTTVPSSEYTVSYTNNKNAGTATVTLTDKEGGNFKINGSKTFTITKTEGSLKQNPSGIANLSYNGKAQNLITAGSSETGTVEYSLDKTNYDTTIPTGTDAKSYTVYYRVKGDANHKDASSGSVNVTIAKAALTISAGYYEIYEGGAIPEFTISYEGFKNNETEAVLTTKPTVSCKATTNSKSGEYAISVSGAKADNYSITHQSGKLVILAMKFVSGGDTSKDTDDAATYQITSTESRGSSTPTVAITDDKEVSGAFAIPETVTYYNKTYTVTEIGESAFENNKNLTEVVIPSSITGIGNNAFKGCVNLQAITVYNPTPINLSAVGTRGEGTRSDGSIFDGVNKALCILYVPDESVELYKKALVWRDFQHIVPLSTNTTGINGITQTEDEPFDIYNLQGQKVKSKATDLNGLPKGIYIINGKKYAVK